MIKSSAPQGKAGAHKAFDAPAAGRALLRWYDLRRRTLPWRAPPGEASAPYAVWLSEIMLQQTTVAVVKTYFEKFLARWPSVDELAAAPLDDVLAEWAGLGYYARARNLHACAQVVTQDYGGAFPRSEAELLKLPGVGPYTAAAIAAIAFDAPCVAIDGNVERVMTRLHAIETPVKRAKAQIREMTLAMLPRRRSGDFAQALMDLGATVCTPRAPACVRCPLTKFCAARRDERQALFPVKEAKAQKPKRRGAIFILRRGDDVLLHRRPPRGLFGGMSAFPATTLTQDVGPEEWLRFAPSSARWRALSEPVTHVFTHFSLTATVFVARTASRAAPEQHRWAACANLDKEGLPSLMRKAAAQAGLGEADGE